MTNENKLDKQREDAIAEIVAKQSAPRDRITEIATCFTLVWIILTPLLSLVTIGLVIWDLVKP